MFIETKKLGWRTVRDTISSVDTTLAVTARKWADRPTAKLIEVPEKANAAFIRFRHSTNSATANYTIYVYREKDDAEFVCTGTATAGTQTPTMLTSASAATYYAKKITCTHRWVKTASSSDTSGNNEMAKLAFDLCGVKYILPELTALSTGNCSVDVAFV